MKIWNRIKDMELNIGKLLFIIIIILLVVSVFLINVVAIKLETRFSLVGDLTGNAAYRIGTETKTVLQSLTKDVEIFVLAEEASFVGDSYLVQANRIMNEYSANSERVSLEYIDYVMDPTFVSRYPELVLEKGNIIVSCGENTEQIKLTEMFNYERNAAGDVLIVSSRAEEVMTSSILSVVSEQEIHVAMLKGNGVVNSSDFGLLLSENGFILEEVNIATDALDSKYDIAMLLAPQVDLSEAAIENIDSFLYNDGEYGKMLLYTADVTQEQLPVTEAYLREWGVVVGDGAVFETKADRTYQSQPFYPVVDYAEEEYSSLLIDPSVPMIMPLARPLETLFSVRDKHYTTQLLTFANTAGVRPSSAIDFDVDNTKKWGPMPAMVLASKKFNKTDGTGFIKSDILVFSSSKMLEAFTIGNASLANSEYIVKLLNESFGKTQGVAIVPKSLAGDVLTMNTKQKNIIGLVLALFVPLLILAAGIAVYAIRRYK